MMKQTRTYTYKKVNIKDGKVKLTTSDAFDDDVFIVFLCLEMFFDKWVKIW